MTIVLQHRFWDLIVSDDRFEVKLTFDGIPERLVVPFAAIKVFIDPSVRYGLQFEEEASDRELAASPPRALTADGDLRPGSARPMPIARAPCRRSAGRPASSRAIRKDQTARLSGVRGQDRAFAAKSRARNARRRARTKDGTW